MKSTSARLTRRIAAGIAGAVAALCAGALQAQTPSQVAKPAAAAPTSKFAAIAIPTLKSALVVTVRTPELTTDYIYLRAPCGPRDTYHPERVRSYKSPTGSLPAFEYCPDGSAFLLAAYGSEAEVAAILPALQRGSLRDLNGAPFTWPAFTVGERVTLTDGERYALEDDMVRRSLAVGPVRQLTTTPDGKPDATAILNVHGAVNARYYSGQLSGVPGEVGYPPVFGSGVGYYERRAIDDLSCVAAGPGAYRCSYVIAKSLKSNTSSLVDDLRFAGMTVSAPTRFTYTYTQQGGAWVSADLELATRNEAAARSLAAQQQKTRQDGDDSMTRLKDQERKDAFDRCQNQFSGVACIY